MIGDSSTLKLLLGLNSSQNNLNKALTKLASGSRINSAADDAAGLAVSEGLRAEAAVNEIGVRNVGDGQSQAAIAEGSSGQIGEILTRQRELAAQAANGTLNSNQRQALNNEFQQLSQEAQRIVETTSFNGQQLLDGEAGTSIQAGESVLTGPSTDLSSIVADQGDILTQESALGALDDLSTKQSQLSSIRSESGAFTARLDTAVAGLERGIVELEAAFSRVRDVDYAKALTERVTQGIRGNASVGLLAQANQNAANVLRLLQ